MRYHLTRPVDAPDGRRERARRLDGWAERIDAIQARFGDVPCRASVLHELLVREYGFTGSYQAVRRYLRHPRGTPPVQAIRRLETPPGVQAQHDWFGSSPLPSSATGPRAGAGAILPPAFQTFARTGGFSVDPCRPATASDKGKVERQVRTDRTAFAALFVTAWPTLEAFQQALDGRAHELLLRHRCPATGTGVAAALAAEQPLLQPVPARRCTSPSTASWRAGARAIVW